jgi:soluble lytic murein transglycosylase-like protein
MGLAFSLACGFATQARASEECLANASAKYRVNPLVLRAILWNESRFNPRAMNHNANGTVDHGIAQINSVHLKELERHGIGSEQLMQACPGIEVAAWLLAKQMVRYGNTWFAVGAYHSATPELNARYVGRIKATLSAWKVR